MNPQQPGSAPGPTVGYCRACGRALDAASVRSAHGTIYCADHMPAAAPGFSGTSAGFADSPYSSPYASTTPPPLPNRGASPGLAFLLGLIPGVGAVYNGQYGKGLVHVVIVGLLISILSNDAAHGLEPLMGLLLAGFWAYMAFEAFHTAKRRKLGQPVDEFSSVLPTSGAPSLPAAPVILIALGVVFLLSNLGVLEIRRMLRYWPVLLIGMGVYMLIVRLSGATRDNRPSTTTVDATPVEPAASAPGTPTGSGGQS